MQSSPANSGYLKRGKEQFAVHSLMKLTMFLTAIRAKVQDPTLAAYIHRYNFSEVR